MKFYVAGRLKQIDKVKEIQNFIKERGHHIIEDWTIHLPPKPYDDDIEKSAKYAELDIKSAMESDVFVLLTDDTGAGMYTELGAAIANKIHKGKPNVYVIGDYLRRSMFFFHPEVKRKENISNVFEDLSLL
jgi:nucleoside 2-deoxyribosyltransferase